MFRLSQSNRLPTPVARPGSYQPLKTTARLSQGYRYQGGASWWTAEYNDRISMKKTNYIKITMLSFLKVYILYGYYTNCQFYQISLFCQLKIVFHKISKNHFFKDCILNFTWSSLKLTSTLEIALLFKIHNTMQSCRLEWNLCQINGVLNFTYTSYAAHMHP